MPVLTMLYQLCTYRVLGIGLLYTVMSLGIYLSVLNHMDQVASTVAEKGLNFKLREGFSAETSGNILPCVYTPVSLMFRRLTKDICKKMYSSLKW